MSPKVKGEWKEMRDSILSEGNPEKQMGETVF